MEPTFDNLQSILQNQKLEGNMLTCTFKATNQQQGLDAMHMFVPTQEEIMALLPDNVEVVYDCCTFHF